MLIVYAAVIAHTITAFYTDLRTRRIPNVWNGAVGITGGVFHLAAGGLDGLRHAIVGALALFLITSILYVLGAIGGGDVKWFAALGAWSGLQFSIYTLIYTMLFAGAVGLSILIGKRKLFRMVKQWTISLYCFGLYRDAAHVRSVKRQPLHEIPLMIAVLPAVAVVLWRWMEGEIL